MIFRAERGAFPVSWASHLALTDESGQRFTYDQRSEIGPQVDIGGPAGWGGFDLAIRGGSTRALADERSMWQMSGMGGHDALAATARTNSRSI